MKIRKTIRLMLAFAFAILSITSYSQSSNKLNAKIKTETIETLSKLLVDFYVIPEKGKKMAEQLNENLLNGKYDNMNEFSQFASTITNDLFEIAKDKHLNIYYSPSKDDYFRKLQTLSESEKNEATMRQKTLESDNNFGFKKLEIMSGNIGYVQLSTFANIDYASETATSAMFFLSNTEAIIIDLRNNNGGWPATVQFLASYFYDYSEGGNTVLFEQHITSNNQIISYPVLPYLPGKRMANTPLYILTNKYSISAAECFAYSLQKLGRATVIGEQTGFGAHATRGPEILNDFFMLKLPVGKMISPVTKTTWEGVGVIPDIITDGKDALTAALEIIRPKQKTKKLKDETIPTNEKLKQYMGTYEFVPENNLIISVTGSQVLVEITGRPGQFEITQMEQDRFQVPGMDIYVTFIKENRIVTGLNFSRSGNENYAKKIK